jgi:hypothetical protein
MFNAEFERSRTGLASMIRQPKGGYVLSPADVVRHLIVEESSPQRAAVVSK